MREVNTETMNDFNKEMVAHGQSMEERMDRLCCAVEGLVTAMNHATAAQTELMNKMTAAPAKSKDSK